MPPRAALGHIFAATLAVLEHSSICHGLSRLLPDTAWFLRRQQSALHHRAKFIARLLVNRLPVVYSLARATDAVADRWRCQLNENAGVMCHTSTLPEHNHNELVGMGQPAPFGRQAVLIVLVDRPDTHARTQRRLNSVLSVTRGSFSRIVRATSRGPTRLARVFSLIMLGDLVSVELARLRGKDAMEIDRIDRLKKLMARTRR
jgi:glucose/mannose-6-phosphate isomerase